MNDRRVIQRAKLVPGKHAPTGNTVHRRGSRVLGPPAVLEIIQYVDDEGFYLMHFDSNGEELTDTYHDSIEEAEAQAKFEFGIEHAEWSSE